MTENEIHKNLESKELRDFLNDAISNISYAHEVSSEYYDARVKRIQAQIKALENELVEIKKFHAFNTIMEMRY